MTPEEKQMMDEIDDLAKFASVEAAKRMCKIADVMPDQHTKIMVGLRASKSLFMSYVLTAVQNGMPVGIAGKYICDTMEQLGELLLDASKEDQ